MKTQAKASPLQPVANVDLTRYVGKWYEIASYPNSFQRDCYCTTAEYTLTDNGYVIVENRCNRGSVDGKQSYIKGKAFTQRKGENGKLKVQFFWPFRSNYWIIDLAEDYSYAVISEPGRKYLWILSRTPFMTNSILQHIMESLENKGFDIAHLKLTPQKLSNKQLLQRFIAA
jgi:apolipoprotein D and lipocalin family protein